MLPPSFPVVFYQFRQFNDSFTLIFLSFLNVLKFLHSKAKTVRLITNNNSGPAKLPVIFPWFTLLWHISNPTAFHSKKPLKLYLAKTYRTNTYIYIDVFIAFNYPCNACLLMISPQMDCGHVFDEG